MKKEKPLHLLLNGKAKEIAMTLPVKKRAEILNNLIVSSMLDQSLVFEIQKVFSSEDTEEIIEQLPFFSGGVKIKPAKTKIMKKSPTRIIKEKIVNPKPVIEENLKQNNDKNQDFSSNHKKEEEEDNDFLDQGGFFN